MFLDCLDLIFSSLESVVKALDFDIFSVATVGVSLWELILGLLTIGIIFGFFLAPRMGSGLGGIGNLKSYQNQKNALTKSESYDEYANKRARNEWYSRRYNAERGRGK